MTYPFVSIVPIIDELAGYLKTIVKTSQFSRDDIYGWMIEGARLINSAAYETDSAYLTIKKHTALLPPDFYLLNKIELCEVPSNPPEPMVPYDVAASRWIFTRVLAPADSATKSLMTDKCPSAIQDRTLNYTLKVPPGVARFSFSAGTVHIDYEKLKRDENNEVLVMDEPNVAPALKAYAEIRLVKEKFVQGSLSKYIYDEIKGEWDTYSTAAKRNISYPSQAENDYNLLKQDSRYRRFSYKLQ